MEKQLLNLISELLKIQKDEIDDSLTMRETDLWDSLKHMELIAAIEKTFEIELTFDEIVAMQSYKNIKDILTKKKATV